MSCKALGIHGQRGSATVPVPVPNAGARNHCPYRILTLDVNGFNLTCIYGIYMKKENNKIKTYIYTYIHIYFSLKIIHNV